MIIVPLLAIFNLRCCWAAPTIADNPDTILKELLDKGRYEKRLRPLSTKKALMVECTMYVVSLGPVSEVDMTFKLGIYFRQYWRDPRLQFNSSMEQIVLSQDLLEQLWLPDSFFQTETESYIHEVTKPNVFFRLYQNGTILMSIRVTVTSRCPMDLRYFPMDTQECELRIASWGFTQNDLQYEWKRTTGPPIKLADDITLSNFRVVNYQWDSYIRNLSTGEWDTLAVTFRFGRNTLYFIIQMYIPSTLIVMVSWVSFWVGRASVPARAALGITTVLTLLTLISSTNANMPKISYMKAIDVYFAGCFLFVFASLIEFAAVCYLDKEGNPQNFRQTSPNLDSRANNHAENAFEGTFLVNSRDLTGSRTSLQHNHQGPKHRSSNNIQPFSTAAAMYMTPRRSTIARGEINVGSIDRFSRYFFPLTFTVLMVSYWYVYYQLSTDLNVVGEDAVILENL